MPTTTKDEAARTPGQDTFRPGVLVRNERYDHRGAYPAHGEAAYVQAVDGEYLDFGQGSKLHYSLFAPVFPAPASQGVLWSAWPEDDCDSDPRIDPMAQKVTEWFVGRWPVGADEPECRILIGEGRSAEIVARRIAEKLTSVLNTDAIQARKASAPASPGVPDSLRETLEFYANQWNADCDAVLLGPGANDWSGGSVGYEATEALSKDAGARARKALRTIATHPAGQSAGSGAEDRQHAAEVELQEIEDGAYGDSPMTRGAARDRLSTLNAMVNRKLERYRASKGEPCAWAGGNDTCYCRTCGEEYCYGREDKPVCPRKTAPDSTRTGDEGTEENEPVATVLWYDPDAHFGEKKPHKIIDASMAFMDAAEIGTKLYARPLAARPAAPEAQGAWVSQAAVDVLAERRRQVEAEGWTPEHDDRHEYSALATAAACYIRQGRYCYPEPGKPGADWPWAPEWWKPSSYRRNLVKAGALILAEIERLDRLPAPPASSGQEG